MNNVVVTLHLTHWTLISRWIDAKVFSQTNHKYFKEPMPLVLSLQLQYNKRFVALSFCQRQCGCGFWSILEQHSFLKVSVGAQGWTETPLYNVAFCYAVCQKQVYSVGELKEVDTFNWALSNGLVNSWISILLPTCHSSQNEFEICVDSKAYLPHFKVHWGRTPSWVSMCCTSIATRKQFIWRLYWLCTSAPLEFLDITTCEHHYHLEL